MTLLRPYQTSAIESLRNEFKKGNKRIALHMPTGSGKGLIMSQIANNALEKDLKVLTVMRRRELIFQTIKNYEKYHKIISSPIMAGLKGFDSKNPSQVCSIDTIRSRIKNNTAGLLKAYDIIIIDEMHDTSSNTYKDFFDFIGDKVYIGFSATPFGVDKFWQSFVKPIEPKELREQGFLCPARIFAPSTIDTSHIKIKRGEFDEKELFKKATESKIVGDIVETYKNLGENKPAILFAINKLHSSIMCEAFNSAGIPAIHQDESHNSKERAFAIDNLIKGKIKILCNVNIFSTGIDLPSVVVGIMARPTNSEILWVQQLGRLLRPASNKDYAIILDHAGNTERHGGPFIIRDACYKNEKKKTSEILTRLCDKCFSVLEGHPTVCEYCGNVFKTKKNNSNFEAADGTLIEVIECEVMQRYLSLKRLQKDNDWKKMAIWFKLYDQFGEQIYDKLSVPFWAKKILENRNNNVTK